MGLPEVIASVVGAIALAAGLSALVISIAVRRVRRDRSRRGKRSVGV